MASKPYSIHRTSRKGRHMLADQPLIRGTCILAETPLIEFHVGRSARFNEDDFWGAGRYSGGREVNTAYNTRLNDNERATYDGLKAVHRKTNAQLQREAGTLNPLTYAEGVILSQAHTNCFKREYTDVEDVEQTVFTLLDEIASINHACKPNALYQWDDERPNGRGGRGQGVVHALQPIAAGDEITLCYPARLGFILKSRDERRTELRETWNFECACPACVDTSGDPRRQTARDLHTALVAAVPPDRAIPGDTHNLGTEMRQHRQFHSTIESLT